MKKIVILLFICFVVINNSAQQSPGKDHSKLNLSCQTCHTCTVPTRNDPCLVICPRERMTTIYQPAEETPELIVVDNLKERYGPVFFSHRIHAQMSDMSGGCGGCHHFNTSGPILNCNSCHETERKREDVSVPDLLGAYHRQCMDCHRDWSHSTNCNSCHLPIKDVKGTEQEQLAEKLKGKDHPVVLEPTKVVFKTQSEKGKLATFFHSDHTKKFNLDCISCHKQESCLSCHDVQKKSDDEKTKVSNVSKLDLSFEEQHKNCMSCHKKEESCSTCHSDKELLEFDHLKSTSWQIKSYHSKLTCQKCHGTSIPFAKVDRNCVSCHKDWNAETFKHEITGLKLDEIHESFECTDCHAENNYSAKPNCDNCHEDYVYPKMMPGKLINK